MNVGFEMNERFVHVINCVLILISRRPPKMDHHFITTVSTIGFNIRRRTETRDRSSKEHSLNISGACQPY